MNIIYLHFGSKKKTVGVLPFRYFVNCFKKLGFTYNILAPSEQLHKRSAQK